MLQTLRGELQLQVESGQTSWLEWDGGIELKQWRDDGLKKSMIILTLKDLDLLWCQKAVAISLS